MVEYPDFAVPSSKLISTYFPVLVRAKRAPQKVNPNPTKAAICNSKKTAKTSKTTPNTKNTAATFEDELLFFRITLDSSLHLKR